MRKQLQEFIDRQHSQPKGIWGILFGEKMALQHRPEMLWTVDLLRLKQEESILELGCGSGYAMKLLLQQPTVKQVVGLDISQTMVGTSTIRNRDEVRRGRARFVQGNVNHLAFKDNYFSKVFSIHSVYFWDNLPHTMAEIYRVLKPTGTLIITLSNGMDGEPWDEINDMLEQQLIPIMQQSGFENIKLLRGANSRQYHTIAVRGNK